MTYTKNPKTIEDIFNNHFQVDGPVKKIINEALKEAHALGMKEEAAKTALLPPSYDKVVERGLDGNEEIRPAETVIRELKDENEKLQSHIKELEENIKVENEELKIDRDNWRDLALSLQKSSYEDRRKEVLRR